MSVSFFIMLPIFLRISERPKARPQDLTQNSFGVMMLPLPVDATISLVYGGRCPDHPFAAVNRIQCIFHSHTPEKVFIFPYSCLSTAQESLAVILNMQKYTNPEKYRHHKP